MPKLEDRYLVKQDMMTEPFVVGRNTNKDEALYVLVSSIVAVFEISY